MTAFKQEVLKRCAAKTCPWNLATLATVISISPTRLSRFINCVQRRLPADMAQLFAIALGEDPGFWMTLYFTGKLELLRHHPLMEARLAAIRERRDNWKPDQKQEQYSKAYHRGWEAGYVAGKNEAAGAL